MKNKLKHKNRHEAFVAERGNTAPERAFICQPKIARHTIGLSG
ncbi:hypothetical protein [Emticicia sp. 17c]